MRRGSLVAPHAIGVNTTVLPRWTRHSTYTNKRYTRPRRDALRDARQSKNEQRMRVMKLN